MCYPQQMPFYKITPVSSEADISRYTIDFSGSPTYFYNQAANEIIVKQFDMRTGVISSQKFIREHQPEETKNPYEEQFKSITDRLDSIEETIQKGGKNAK